MDTKTLTEFLTIHAELPECGLVLAARGDQEQVRRGVQSAGYEVTDDYWTAISHLEHGRSVALQIAGELPRELFDLVNQYNARRGIVQVLEQPSLKIRLVQLDPLASRLLLVMANEDEAPNSERYQGRLLEAVGIVTRV